MDPDLAVRMAHPDDRPLVETLLRGVRLVQGLTSQPRGELHVGSRPEFRAALSDRRDSAA